MLKSQIKVGGHYLAKVAGVVTTVRVDAIDLFSGGTVTRYSVTNLRTGRRTMFRSAAKFRAEVKPTNWEAVNETSRQIAPRSDPVSTAEEVKPVPTSEVSAQDHSEASYDAAGELSAMHTDPALAQLHRSGLAARIAAVKTGRAVGEPVAGMVPNEEQEAILALAASITVYNGVVLVVVAGAGTGKTASLKMLAKVLRGKGQGTAFNTSLVSENKPKFDIPWNTTHSLAFRAVGKQYQHRLGGERVRSSQVARILGIEDMKVVLRGQGEPDEEGKPTDKVKVLQPDFLAGQVLVAVRKFCQSADSAIGSQHINHIAGIDAPDTPSGARNNDRVRDYLIPFCEKAWADLSNVNGELPFTHDCYVKLWQLGTGNDRPVIAADYILLDEAQDTAPVFLSILQQQTHAMLVLVGDDNQQIYEWRGAVNAMGSFKDAPRRLLSQSYRFGQAIADVANTVLATLEQPTDLVMRGNPAIPSRVDAVSRPSCYLYRTNAGAVGRVMQEIADKRRPHLIGGSDEVVKWVQAAMDLQAKRGTRHPELCCFETWKEVEEYSKTDEGSDMKLMVSLVNTFGAQKIRDALRDMSKEQDADVVVSTAHRSKGREWDTVRLGPDFPTANKMTDADRRLLYVAATRAKLTLDVSDCPPFCGGNSEGERIPGLRVAYTQPMPTREEQEAYVQDKDRPTVTISSVDGSTTPSTNGQPVVAEPAKQDAGWAPDGRWGWTKHDGVWCVRGPDGGKRGQKLKIQRRDGPVTILLVDAKKRYPDATIYTIAALGTAL